MTRTVSLQLPSTRTHLAGETWVRRALPRRQLRRVGPFVFLDHFGPSTVEPGALDVPPHPHVGLATLTYLYSGALEHKDSLGSVQKIAPGAVNWMTAGRGIVHSELSTERGELHGIQTWVALPHAERKRDPAFDHHAAETLPVVEGVRVLAGRLGDLASPVASLTPVTYLDVVLSAGADRTLPVAGDHELAVYVASGTVLVGGTPVETGVLAKLADGGGELRLATSEDSRLVVLGGATMPEPTVIHWNFVIDSIEEGREEMARWERGEFPLMPGASPSR